MLLWQTLGFIFLFAIKFPQDIIFFSAWILGGGIGGTILVWREEKQEELELKNQ